MWPEPLLEMGLEQGTHFWISPGIHTDWERLTPESLLFSSLPFHLAFLKALPTALHSSEECGYNGQLGAILNVFLPYLIY